MASFEASEFTRYVLRDGDVRAPTFSNAGRSPRINGLIERFESIFECESPALMRRFEPHMIDLADALLSSGSNGSWLAGFVADQVATSPLMLKLRACSRAELAVLEEIVARWVVAMQPGDVS